MNVSVAATVDSTDNSQLTIVATLVPNNRTATAGDSSIGDDGDVAMLLIPRFTNGRAGSALGSESVRMLTSVGAGYGNGRRHF